MSSAPSFFTYTLPFLSHLAGSMELHTHGVRSGSQQVGYLLWSEASFAQKPNLFTLRPVRNQSECDESSQNR